MEGKNDCIPESLSYSPCEPKEEHLKVLKDPALFDRVDAELDKTIEGENGPRKAILLSSAAIFAEGAQVNTCVNSASSAGKDWICKSIFDLLPFPLCTYRNKITPEAFTYWHNPRNDPNWSWEGKLLLLTDISGAVLNSNCFKVMCSEGSISTVVKDQRAIDIPIVGKPIMLITTANAQPSEEILNRFNLIRLDESEDQTRRILRRQAHRAANKEQPKYSEEIKDALFCLKRIRVVIPFAEKIAERFPGTALRARRDFVRFLDLIKASTALHQYQRQIETTSWGNEVIDAAKEDYEIARSAMNNINTDGFLALTQREAKAWEACKAFHQSELQGKAFTVPEIHAFKPLWSQQSWYDFVNRLAAKGLLHSELEQKTDSEGRNLGKPVVAWTPVLDIENKLKLPSFEEL